MVESIFVDPRQLEAVAESGANHLMVALEGLDQTNWQRLSQTGMDFSIALNAFDKDICPADPAAKKKMFTRISQALRFSAAEIWLDYFRFGGDCTDIENSDANKAHPTCQFCQGVDRQQFINNLAKEVVNHVSGKCQIGYFAVAFRDSEAPDLAKSLGLDYQALGQIFDLSSPMLYHRMIKKPVSYISDYVKWMAEKTGKGVLPIIQIKDMPDDLPDEMTPENIKQAFDEAIKEPSLGVAIFWWKHAIEKNKTDIISQLFLHK